MRKFKLHDGKQGAALTVRVTPRASKTTFGGVLEDGTVRVRVSAPPLEGRANTALVKFLAKVLGVNRSRVEIVAGEKGLDKILSIIDMNAEQVEERIQCWMAENQKSK
ncbi:MAG: DUF167 domain-containing protein [Anaerolineales bacterium]|jgi:uncharacterized protein (TIGR00251 family)